MQEFGRRADRRPGVVSRPSRQPANAAEPIRAVEPGEAAASASLPQLLGVSCLGAAVLYFSLDAGWRAGTILGLALVVLPLIEAVLPGFTGKFTNGMELVQRGIYAVGAVVLVCGAAVFGWMWMKQPPRPQAAAARTPYVMARPAGGPASAQRQSDDGARARLYKQGRPMPADGPGSELYVRRLRPERP